MHCSAASLLAHMYMYCGEIRVGSESRNVMWDGGFCRAIAAEMVCQSIRRQDLLRLRNHLQNNTDHQSVKIYMYR